MSSTLQIIKFLPVSKMSSRTGPEFYRETAINDGL